MSKRERISLHSQDIQHSDIRGYGPTFFGFRGWSDSLRNDHHANVYTYNDGNIVTIDGSSGPWAVRQVTGKYTGVVVTFWDNPSVNRSLEAVCDELGFEIHRKPSSLERSSIDEDNLVEQVFDNVEPPESTDGLRNRVPLINR